MRLVLSVQEQLLSGVDIILLKSKYHNQVELLSLLLPRPLNKH